MFLESRSGRLEKIIVLSRRQMSGNSALHKKSSGSTEFSSPYYQGRCFEALTNSIQELAIQASITTTVDSEMV
jgi:hypothetical protein